MKISKAPIIRQEVDKILRTGSRYIAPLWSLENFVAVNVYLGLADWPFEKAMDFLSKSSKTEGTLPISFYMQALMKGKLSEDDVYQALEGNRFGLTTDAQDFIAECLDAKDDAPDFKIQTLVDVASDLHSKRWNRFMVDRISFWASAYFDDKQAAWNTSNGKQSLFQAWKRESEIDRAQEVMGLKGFRKFVKALPENYLDAAAMALEELEIPDEIQEHYLNALLMKMNGWAGVAARVDWDEKLQGRESHALQEFLTIMLVWEAAVKKLLEYPNLDYTWKHAKSESLAILSLGYVDEQLSRRLILQKAFDLANQRSIIQKINHQKPAEKQDVKIKSQAVFCIDVRSEVFRRNLETIDNGIETLGFAGFFAFPVKYVPLAHEDGTNQCPVLLNTSHTIHECLDDPERQQKVIKRKTLRGQIRKAIKSFKQSAISCFGFVSPLGIFFLPKLLTDSFGKTRPLQRPDQIGLVGQEKKRRSVELEQNETHGIRLEDRKRMALSALRAMSFTENFAPTILIVGHGSATTNNPHASGLDCGACGGNSGEANAKVAAAVLNDPEVRESLSSEGIAIPTETLFVPALHNTTTDDVTMFCETLPNLTADQQQNISDLRYALALAGEKSRAERAERMEISYGDVQKRVMDRSSDWSQVRPEWGLAGCSSFIVAPRERTSQLNFGGKAFMHNYTWKKDSDFSVLELIMTAPMVVTSWINLQYYASTVDNKIFGSGNKTLHNVVGGMGVLEGFAGDLRVGLPWQSVNDGKQYQHEPQRLNVIIEAPVDEMSKILEKHESVRQLCDNEWIFLFAINEEGKVKYRYAGDLQWEVI